MGRGAWRATVHGVAESQTRLSTHAWHGTLSGWRSSFLFLAYLMFCHERVLDFVRCFFCVYWDDHMVPFPLFLEYCVLVDFFDVKSILHSWDESHSFTVFYPSICCWLSIARILLRMFSSIFLPGFTLCICWWVWCCPTGLWSSVNFSVFFFFFVLYVISVDILSSLLIVSPGRSNMLLKPSSEFLISVILFFYSIFPIWLVLNNFCFFLFPFQWDTELIFFINSLDMIILVLWTYLS